MARHGTYDRRPTELDYPSAFNSQSRRPLRRQIPDSRLDSERRVMKIIAKFGHDFVVFVLSARAQIKTWNNMTSRTTTTTTKHIPAAVMIACRRCAPTRLAASAASAASAAAAAAVARARAQSRLPAVVQRCRSQSRSRPGGSCNSGGGGSGDYLGGPRRARCTNEHQLCSASRRRAAAATGGRYRSGE